MNQAFSIRASRIIEDTLNAVQQADEMEADLGHDEYVRLMMVLADELNKRAHVAIMKMVGEMNDEQARFH
jgi:hypothetical protein